MNNNKNAILMKTFYFSRANISILMLSGILTLLATSCGSYQNTSYYDNDGVYGSSDNQKPREVESNNSVYYKEYFSNLNKDNEVFTNVDNYSSAQDSVQKQPEVVTNSNYAGWGSNSSDNITINVYDNGGWNNWGWNNGWYGNNWGWGWNNWYGPNWGLGWNNGNLGYNYAYSGGRRNTNRLGSNYPGNASGGRGNISNGGRNTRVFGSRDYNTPSTRSNYNSNNNIRSNNPPRTNYNNNNTTRSNYNNNNTIRNYTPSSTNSGTRSYSPSPSYSSPSSSGGGGFGGGRSGGGGGRR